MSTNKHLRNETGKEDPYIFNNAVNEERIRVDEQSVALNVLMHDKPIRAPISNPKRILELGYGTGLMCHLLGQTFPTTTIYGVDPSPPAEGFHDKLENVEYIQGKYEDLLEANDERLKLGSFDYIFVRMAVCWVKDWPAHMRNIKTLLKDGGWAELQDVSLARHFSPTQTDAVDEDWLWARVVRDLCLKNIDWASGLNLEARMNETGFSEVESIEYPFAMCRPLPSHPETELIAAYTSKYVPPVIFGLLDQYAKEMYSTEEIQGMKDSATNDAYSGRIAGLHWKFHVCIGRK